MGNIKSVIYKNCDEGQKSIILTAFKQIYSREDVTRLVYYDIQTTDKVTIFLENKEIIFINKMEFINFVKNLCRPFILIEEKHNNHVYFVYN